MEMGCNLLFDINLSKSTFDLQCLGEIIEEFKIIIPGKVIVVNFANGTTQKLFAMIRTLLICAEVYSLPYQKTCINTNIL